MYIKARRNGMSGFVGQRAPRFPYGLSGFASRPKPKWPYGLGCACSEKKLGDIYDDSDAAQYLVNPTANSSGALPIGTASSGVINPFSGQSQVYQPAGGTYPNTMTAPPALAASSLSSLSSLLPYLLLGIGGIAFISAVKK